MPRYSQLLLKIDPITGVITYDFNGHISATGLDLKASLTNVITDINRVRWVADDGSGRVVAVIQAVGRSTFDQGELQLYAYRPSLSGVGGTARLDLVAAGSANPQGQIRAITEDTSGVINGNRLILGSGGSSDFELTHGITEMVANGATAALGSSFQVIPGLTVTLAMTAGAVALLEGFGTLNRTSNTPSLFWVINPAGGGQTSLTDRGGESSATGLVSVPCYGRFVAPTTQNYTFSIQATCPGGGATAQNPGYGRVTITGP